MRISTTLFALASSTLVAAQSVADSVPADTPVAPVTANDEKPASLEELKSKVSDLFYDNGVFDLEAIESRLQV